MRQTPALVPVTFLAFLLVATIGLAQPSGGPYGPIPRNYPLPDSETVFFVAPDGKADASGKNLEEPTRLKSALTRAETGDAIVLRGGLYRTGSLVFNQGITLQPYANERPILTGTRPATEWERVTENRWRTRWNRLFPAAPADWWRAERHVAETPLHRFNYDMVFLDDHRLLSVGRLEDLTEDSYYIDYENGWVYLGTDPTGREVEITAHDSALIRTIRRVHGRNNDHQGPTIRGITFTRYARLALLVEGIEPGRPMDPAEFGNEIVGTTLEHLTISHCSRVAGYFRGNGLTIRHCLVSDTGTEGIYVINSADVLLERNIVTRTNSRPYYSGYYASAIKIFNQSHRVVVRDNLIIDNPNASGIWYDVGNVDGLIVDNWVERTNDGFFFEISQGALAAGNVFVDCEPGVRILNSADVALYQNTFYNSPLQIHRTERGAEGGDHFGWHVLAGPGVDERNGHVAHNNLFFADHPMPDGFVQIWQTPVVAERASGRQLAALDGNVYASPAENQPLVRWTESPESQPDLMVDPITSLPVKDGDFESRGAAFLGYDGPVVRGALLKRFELLKTFPGATTGVPLPDRVREALEWHQAKPFPGAYPPVRP